MYVMLQGIISTLVGLFLLGCPSSASECTSITFPNIDKDTVVASEKSIVNISFNATNRCLDNEVLQSYSIIVEKQTTRHICNMTISQTSCKTAVEQACQCSKDAFGFYHLLKIVDKADNGVWTWSAITAGKKESKSLDVNVTTIDDTSLPAETTAPTSSATKPQSGRISTLECDDTTRRETTQQPPTHSTSSIDPYIPISFGTTMLIFNGLVVVAIITMVVVVVIKRRGGRTRLLQEVLLHQLRQQRVRHQSPPRLQLQPLAEFQNRTLEANPPGQVAAGPNNTANDSQSTLHVATRGSNIYEIVNDDDGSDEGTGANDEASDGQMVEKNVPDSLPPTASEQDVLVTQNRDPVYQNQSQPTMQTM